MALKGLLSDFRIPGRKLLALTLLFSNTLLLFYVFHDYLASELLKDFGNFYVNFGNILFFGFAVSFGIAGSLILERIQRRKFLWFWLFFEVLTVIPLMIFSGLTFSLIFCAVLGIVFGLGFPTIQSLVTEATTFEERGRVAAILFLVWGLLFVAVLMSSQELGVRGVAAVCTVAAGSGFVALFIDPCQREAGPKKNWQSIATSRSFVYFAVPWLMFQIANGVLVFGSLSSEFTSVTEIAAAAAPLGSIFAIPISGFLADLNGRKQPIILGLILLGASYSVFGLVNTPTAFIAYSLVEGFAWGIITVTYLQVILGDLSSGFGSKERFFVLGGMVIPFFIYIIFSLVEIWYPFKPIQYNILALVLGLLIFASVAPVWYAPETMPEAKLREKKLKRHVERVAKLVEKYKKTE